MNRRYRTLLVKTHSQFDTELPPSVLAELLARARAEVGSHWWRPRHEETKNRFIHLMADHIAAICHAANPRHTPEWRHLRRKVIGDQSIRCSMCGAAEWNDVTVDHILPVSKYPELALTLNNLRVLCRSCNSRKGAS